MNRAAGSLRSSLAHFLKPVIPCNHTRETPPSLSLCLTDRQTDTQTHTDGRLKATLEVATLGGGKNTCCTESRHAQVCVLFRNPVGLIRDNTCMHTLATLSPLCPRQQVETWLRFLKKRLIRFQPWRKFHLCCKEKQELSFHLQSFISGLPLWG